jgi:hypothetical protein
MDQSAAEKRCLSPISLDVHPAPAAAAALSVVNSPYVQFRAPADLLLPPTIQCLYTCPDKDIGIQDVGFQSKHLKSCETGLRIHDGSYK